MIYKKNGKILVPTSGSGLCKTCCADGEPCDYCEGVGTPAKVTITLSGIIDCGCYGSEASYFKSMGDIAAAFNDIPIVVPQINPCLWFLDYYPGDYGHFMQSVYSDCSSGIELPWTRFKVHVARGIDVVQVEMYTFGYTDSRGRLFYGSTEEITECMNCTISGETDPCGIIIESPLYSDMCSHGTCLVEEGDTT